MIPELGDQLREVDMITGVGEELQYGLYKRQEEVVVYPVPDEQEIEDMVPGDERERHWSMVFEDNNGRVGGKKAFHHSNR